MEHNKNWEITKVKLKMPNQCQIHKCKFQHLVFTNSFYISPTLSGLVPHSGGALTFEIKKWDFLQIIQ
ncbi:hypothetical protein COV24_01835 [candidate division WWE3 bacterium CG10_big_fil_rev_8_21_14_0_10_32_10]|uniref:Uncharacterized protein n=1 Tax=candidate division WWE3 bacterium CG10_big_fil_rev_8_21_14_0_10_32_10 TaxID=1975090 RepID=A0A2H0RC48_UNCKA|nr:MAG: hypothetical protein COV24_01835 [candidate division WWE3 bacterium CG10_big_fil_rev_8_21_14_0_10_32_10]